MRHPGGVSLPTGWTVGTPSFNRIPHPTAPKEGPGFTCCTPLSCRRCGTLYPPFGVLSPRGKALEESMGIACLFHMVVTEVWKDPSTSLRMTKRGAGYPLSVTSVRTGASSPRGEPWNGALSGALWNGALSDLVPIPSCQVTIPTAPGTNWARALPGRLLWLLSWRSKKVTPIDYKKSPRLSANRGNSILSWRLNVSFVGQAGRSGVGA